MARPFAVVRGHPAGRYDVVVIGAGIGGLTCAALLARAGARVLVVEQHYMVGGYCSTFRRAGFTFDAGTHFYPLLGNPQTVSGRLLRDLEVDVEWIKMDPVDRFHLPDGWTFDVPADYETYRRRLAAEFPHEADALDRFFDTARVGYLAGMRRYFHGQDSPRAADLFHRSLKEVVDEHIRDPRLRLLLMADCGHWGSAPSRTAFVFDAMLRLAYFLGNYYPRRGSQAFVDALACRVVAEGGDILMGAPVTRIAVHRQTACGVDVEIGPPRARERRHIHADVVISNADMRLTCEQLVGPAQFDPDHLTRLRALRPTLATFLTHIGLRGLSTRQLEEIHGYHWRTWDADEVARDGFVFKLFVPTLYEPAMAPPGGHIIIVQKLVDLEFASVIDWPAHKLAIESAIMGDLERVLPGIASHIVVGLSASAQTSWRYTLNQAGAMLGWEMTPEQLGGARPAQASPIRNLYFVGHWTRPGGGLTPVMISAIQVAAAVAPIATSASMASAGGR